ncbi:MAG: hypothetical protein GEU78_01940 [Actinobacteria bacterium]|nr:hypothetical protein [Actinomycetota bacterium]
MRLKSRVIRLEREGDSEASHDLAVTTHRFSKRAQAVVDDKLTLSATLMRAGEVDEARRLLAEAERDLRSEEAALLRKVEELAGNRAMHRPRVVVLERHRMSRSSLMRTLAVTIAGSVVVALAMMGGAVIGLFEQRPRTGRVEVDRTIDVQPGSSTRAPDTAGASRGVAVRINGVRVLLTRWEWRALKRAQRSGDDQAVSDLLEVIAPELSASAPEAVVEIIGRIGEATGGAGSDGSGSGTGSPSGGSSGSDETTSSGSGSSSGGSGDSSGGSGGSDNDTTGSSKGTGTAEDGGSGGESEPGTSTGTAGTGGIIDAGAGPATGAQTTSLSVLG